MAACLNARWSLWVGSEIAVLEKAADEERTKEEYIPGTDIPFKGHTEPRRLEFSNLVPATDGLSSVFAR